MGKRKRQAQDAESATKRAKTTATVTSHKASSTSTVAAAPLHYLRDKILFPNPLSGKKSAKLPSKVNALYGNIRDVQWNEGGKILFIDMVSHYTHPSDLGVSDQPDHERLPFRVLLELRGPWAGDVTLRERLQHADVLCFHKHEYHKVEPSQSGRHNLVLIFSNHLTYSVDWHNPCYDTRLGQPESKHGSSKTVRASKKARAEPEPAAQGTSPSVPHSDHIHAPENTSERQASSKMTQEHPSRQETSPSSKNPPATVVDAPIEQPTSEPLLRHSLSPNAESALHHDQAGSNRLDFKTSAVRVDSSDPISSSAPLLGRDPTSRSLKPRLSETELKEVQDAIQFLNDDELASFHTFSSSESKEKETEQEQSRRQQQQQLSQMQTPARDLPQPVESPARIKRLSTIRPPFLPSTRPRSSYLGLEVNGCHYRPICEAVNLRSGRMDYLGVVVREPRAKRTMKNSYSLLLSLCDPSGDPSEPLACQLFAPREEHLPISLEKGDAVLIRDIAVQGYQNKAQMIKRDAETLSLAFAARRENEHEEPAFEFAQRVFSISSAESDAVKEVQLWWNSTWQAKMAQPSNLPPLKPNCIAQLRAPSFCDLDAEILDVKPWPFRPTAYGGGSLDVIVTDYTQNSLRDRLDVEAFLGSGCMKGYALRITCWDSQAVQAAAKWQEWKSSGPVNTSQQPIWHFSNLYIKSHLGFLEGNLRDEQADIVSPKIFPASAAEATVTNLLQRKSEYLKKVDEERAAAQAAHMPKSTPARCLTNSLPETSLANAADDAAEDCMYRCAVRIRDYQPKDIKKWAQSWCEGCASFLQPADNHGCPDCDSPPTYQWMFSLLLECRSTKRLVPVVVSNGEAETFLRGMSPTYEASEESYGKLASMLSPAFGLSTTSILAGATIVQSPPFTAGLMAFKKKDSRVLLLTDTQLGAPEEESL